MLFIYLLPPKAEQRFRQYYCAGVCQRNILKTTREILIKVSRMTSLDVRLESIYMKMASTVTCS